jgi:putative hydrolase
MIAAVRNPHTDVLGHCTGRIIAGRGASVTEIPQSRAVGGGGQAAATSDFAVDDPGPLLRGAGEVIGPAAGRVRIWSGRRRLLLPG